MTGGNEITFCQYRDGDESSIMHLFTHCFGKEMQESYWRWRFIRKPENRILIHLAWDGDFLAAHYAISPLTLSINGLDYSTGLSMTTMTDPRYRGLKLFPKLAMQVYDRMAASNFLIVWGFPNSKSHRSFVKDLRWNDIYEIPTMRAAVSKEVKSVRHDVATDNAFSLEYDEKVISRSLIQVKKNREYLRWRYAEHPINKYTNIIIKKDNHVSSFCIVKEYMDSLDIVDFQARDREEGSELLRQVRCFAQINNLKSINCWAPRHHFIHSLCEEQGFINKEPITYFGFRQLRENMVRVSTDYSDWYLQMGDSDVF